MGSRVHVSEYQWRKEQRKQKFKNKKRKKQNDRYKHRRKHRDHDDLDGDDFDVQEWQKKW